MNNGLIEALREREKAIRAQIAQATAEQRKREAKNRKRLAEIIGGALIEADIPSHMKSYIKDILAVAGLDDRARRFLEERGW